MILIDTCSSKVLLQFQKFKKIICINELIKDFNNIFILKLTNNLCINELFITAN